MSWRERPEVGSVLAIQMAEKVGLLLGRRGLWLLLYPVVLYFLLTRRGERVASRKYLERVLTEKVRWWHIYRHFLSFARVTADRFLFLSGRGGDIQVDFTGVSAMHELVDRKKGGLFLAAHFGSFEAARMVGRMRPDIKIRIVMDDQVNQNFMRRMGKADPDFAKMIISPHQSAPSLGVEIAQTMAVGDWVGFLGDRRFSGDRTLQVVFLGEVVSIPAGVFMVAAAFKAPIVAVFPMLKGRRYGVAFETLSSGFDVNRSERAAAMQQLAQAYMDRLESYVRDEPYNWFNFYDFWDVE